MNRRLTIIEIYLETNEKFIWEKSQKEHGFNTLNHFIKDAVEYAIRHPEIVSRDRVISIADFLSQFENTFAMIQKEIDKLEESSERVIHFQQIEDKINFLLKLRDLFPSNPLELKEDNAKT